MLRRAERRRRHHHSALVVGVLLTGCGFGVGCGSRSSSPPPVPDFTLTVTPSSVAQIVGTVSQPITVTAFPKNGFTDTVNVSINGLPANAVSMPAAPLAIPPAGTQQVTFFFPPSTTPGTISLSFAATGGGLSHTAALNFTLNPVSGTAVLQETTGQVNAGTIEIQGLSAGDFNPAYWQQNTINWVPDVREPMFTSLTTSPYQNIYSPFAVQQSGGWRMFYGGWDGSDTPNDRIYSVTTSDFLTFSNRILVIDNGALQEVNDVNVQQGSDGSLHMMCTGATYDGRNWPTYFSSPDGVVWNGTPEPYQAQLSDIVNIQGYSDYQAGGFNAGNVLFRETSDWELYFYDNFGAIAQIYRATGTSPQVVQYQSVALQTGADPNSVNKFVVGGQTWYLMGLMSNAPQLWYSLSNDGLTFAPTQTLFTNLSSLDTSMDTVSFVTKGSQVLGTLYGANTGTPDNQLSDNAIFARWLQKKLVITDSSGVQYFAQGSYGPDRQWFQLNPLTPLEGTMVVYAEDGLTPLGSNVVNLVGGKSYRLSVP